MHFPIGKRDFPTRSRNQGSQRVSDRRRNFSNSLRPCDRRDRTWTEAAIHGSRVAKDFVYVPNWGIGDFVYAKWPKEREKQRDIPHRGSSATARDAVRRSLDVGRRGGVFHRDHTSTIAARLRSPRDREVEKRSRISARFFADNWHSRCPRSDCLHASVQQINLPFLGVWPAIWYVDAALAAFLVI